MKAGDERMCITSVDNFGIAMYTASFRGPAREHPAPTPVVGRGQVERAETRSSIVIRERKRTR